MSTRALPLKIVAENDECEARVIELTKRLNINNKQTSSASAVGIVLFVSTDGLSLAAHSDPESRVTIDFSTGKNAHRRKFGGGINQTLPRAVGMNKSKNLQIVDATGGFARDAFVLASLGAELTVLEQSPILCLMIEDALRLGVLDDDIKNIMQRMKVRNCNSIDALSGPDFYKTADVVYMDPMYPSRQKNAAVKKDMQLLHLMIGPDHSAEELLHTALLAARKRVVVKRPSKAAPLSTQRLAGSISSKNTRYDIYTPKYADHPKPDGAP